MHERANGLSPGEADVATVKRLVTSWYNALRNTTYECPGEKLMMTQLLHEVKMSLDNGDSVDLEILLDRIAEIFHVDEAEVENEDTSLQARLSREPHFLSSGLRFRYNILMFIFNPRQALYAFKI